MKDELSSWGTPNSATWVNVEASSCLVTEISSTSVQSASKHHHCSLLRHSAAVTAAEFEVRESISAYSVQSLSTRGLMPGTSFSFPKAACAASISRCPPHNRPKYTNASSKCETRPFSSPRFIDATASAYSPKP